MYFTLFINSSTAYTLRRHRLLIFNDFLLQKDKEKLKRLLMIGFTRLIYYLTDGELDIRNKHADSKQSDINTMSFQS